MTTLRELNPIAAAQWSYELNGSMTPDNVAGMSGFYANFQCSEKINHIWKTKIYQRTRNGSNIDCPYCDEREAFPGETDFFTTCSEANEMWDFNNNVIDPLHVLATSTKRANFKCNRGHFFNSQICCFTESESPRCKECKLIQNSIVAAMPDIINWWDYEKNGDDKPEKHYKTDSEKKWWECPKCSYSWKSEINSRYASKNQCPCCDLGIAFKKGVNDLGTKCPDSVKDWNKTKNGKQSPEDIFLNHKNNVWWKCHVCQYEWNSLVVSHFISNCGILTMRKCPSCSGKKAQAGVNSILETHPEMAKEYITELNDVPVTKIRYGSNTKRVWRCDNCHQIYKSTPNSKVRKDGAGGCPYCANKLPIQGVNDLATCYKTLVEEWDYTLNLKGPEHFLPNSNEEVYWFCYGNPSHSWKATIIERTNGYKTCPICDRIRKGYSLFETNPNNILEYWDTEKNNSSPESYTSYSNKKVFWKCKMGHSIEAPICSFTLNEFYCTICNNKKLLKGDNDALTHYPEIVSIWDKDGNDGLLPNEVIYSRKSEFSFTCELGHTWKNTIENVVTNKFTCDYCTNRKLSLEFHSLGAVEHLIASEWDTKINDCSPWDVYPTNKNIVSWLCDKCSGQYNASINERVEGAYKCPYCEGRRALPGQTSFLALHPDLAKEFSKDNDLNPDKILPTNDSYVDWICESYNLPWRATIRQRVNNDIQCPYCSGKKAVPGKTSFLALYPEIASEYAADNIYIADELTPECSVSVGWNCSTCNMRWNNSIKRRVYDQAVCPYCSDKKAIPGKTSLKALYSDLAKEYADNNSHDSDHIHVTYSLNVNWNCEKYGLQWKASIMDRVNNVAKCPYCSGRKVVPGKSSLKALYSDLAKEYADNNSHDSDHIHVTYSLNVNWNCEKYGLQWKASIMDRVNNVSKCPYCSGRKIVPGKSSLKALYSDLAKEYADNNSHDSDHVLVTYHSKVNWNCERCGLQWNALIMARVNNVVKCPYCSGQKAIPGKTSLKAQYSDLAKEYADNNLYDSDHILVTYPYKVDWNCERYGLQWNAFIRDRLNNMAKCPYCSGKKVVPGKTSFKALYPDIAREYSDVNIYSPDTLFPKYSHSVSWNCSVCNMKWRNSIKQRVNGNAVCPYCNDKKAIPGITSFNVNHPDLMEEWKTISNFLLVSPKEINENYYKNVWWTCPNCHKSYSMSVKRRVYLQKRNHESCSYCKGYRRKKRHIF